MKREEEREDPQSARSSLERAPFPFPSFAILRFFTFRLRDDCGGEEKKKIKKRNRREKNFSLSPFGSRQWSLLTNIINVASIPSASS